MGKKHRRANTPIDPLSKSDRSNHPTKIDGVKIKRKRKRNGTTATTTTNNSSSSSSETTNTKSLIRSSCDTVVDDCNPVLPLDNEAGSGRIVPKSVLPTTTASPPTIHPPHRDCKNLYVDSRTVRCAIDCECVPCAYKIGCFDIARDMEFTSIVTNARPELCPRSSQSCPSVVSSDDASTLGEGEGVGGGGVVYGFQKGMNVLTVGDGDFTFSLAVARILFANNSHNDNDNETTSNKSTATNDYESSSSSSSSILFATSYETLHVLQSVYPSIDDTIGELERLGARVCFQVDATNLRRTLPTDVLRLTGAAAVGGVERQDTNDGGVTSPVVVPGTSKPTITSENLPNTTKNKKKKKKKCKKKNKKDRTKSSPSPPIILPPSTNNTTLSNTIKFHRIVWNFPCTAISNGQDGQNDAMEENKRLVQKFVTNATHDLLWKDEEQEEEDGDGSSIRGGGEIHMMHKTKPPYDQWNLQEAALCGSTTTGNPHQQKSTILPQSSHNNNHHHSLEFKGRVVLDKCLIPPYTPRKALDRKSFPCYDACVYIFGWHLRRYDSSLLVNDDIMTIAAKVSGDDNGRCSASTRRKSGCHGTKTTSSSVTNHRFPPTIPLPTTTKQQSLQDKGMGRSAADSVSDDPVMTQQTPPPSVGGGLIVPVMPYMLHDIRTSHLQYASQQHRRGGGQRKKGGIGNIKRQRRR